MCKTYFFSQKMIFFLFFRKKKEIDLSLDSEKIVNDLLFYIDKCYNIKEVEYNNNIYPVYCKVEDDIYIRTTIFPTNPDDVKYILEKIGIIDEIREEEPSELLKKLDNYHLNEIVLTGISDLIFTNKAGINDDDRGSNICKVYLNYYHSCIIKQDVITLYDIAIAFFKLRSHKKDKWYELYSCADVKENGKNSFAISLDFDHGS